MKKRDSENKNNESLTEELVKDCNFNNLKNNFSIVNSIVNIERIQNTFTSKRHFFQRLDDNQIKLVDYLIHKLPQIDKDSWEKRFLLGGVYVNGIPASFDDILNAPCNIEYYEPKYEIDSLENFFPKFDKNNIVYENNGIVVYYKPRKLPTTPSKEQKIYNLRSYLENYYNEKVHLPSRLDTSTQGLVIGSYKEECHKFVQKLFEYKKIQKYYMLKVQGDVPFEEYDCNFCITKSPEHPVLRISSLDGKSARTIFKVIKRDLKEDTTILVARPITGRTHQIRVHISSLGFPIIGDNFYNGKINDELCLVCYKLEFEDEDSNLITIKAPLNLLPSWAREI